jgi:hypothetical protein
MYGKVVTYLFIVDILSIGFACEVLQRIDFRLLISLYLLQE